MALNILFFSLFLILNHTVNSLLKETKQRTVVVFGGNGFVGRSICQEALNRSYRVIAVSRSGIPDIWKSEDWANQVIWYSADALKPKTFTKYISDQKPYAIFTMMGTLNVMKQIFTNQSFIEKIVGETNKNVCNMAKSIQSVQKFVYIGAPVLNLGVEPNPSKYQLWSRFMHGQYNGKLAVEKCVVNNFNENGITFRPNIMAGYEYKQIFGYKIKFNRLPYYNQYSNIYKAIIPDVFDVKELAKDSVDFIEGKDDDTFHCPYHSHQKKPSSTSFVMQNMDNIIIILLSVISMYFTYFILKMVFL